MKSFPKPTKRIKPTSRTPGIVARLRAARRRKKLSVYRAACHLVDLRDRGICAGCLTPARPVHHHHVVFRSQGGADTPENLITLCPHCHARVHDGVLHFAPD